MERVEALRPRPGVRADPVVDGLERAAVQPVEPLTTVVTDLDRASGVDLGRVHALSRGEYRWRITIPDDGALPGRGLVPTLIQWDVPTHPADRLGNANVSLLELAGTHPDPQTIRTTLRNLGLERAMHVSYDRETRLCAMLRTPKGVVTLSS